MKPTVSEEIYQFFVKNGALLMALFLGTAAKIAIDSRVRRLSKKELGVKIVLSFFAGYTGSIYMNSHGWTEQAKWAVPLITLLGESLVMWIMGHSRRIIETVIFTYFSNKKQDKNKNNFGN